MNEKLKQHIDSAKANLVKPIADYATKIIDLVEVEHGLTTEGDYVWHFSNAHTSKPFPKDIPLVVRILKTHLQKSIPDDLSVDVFIPIPEWDKKVCTVMARGLGKRWNFDEDLVTAPLENIGVLLSAQIRKENPRRTSL